MATEKENRKKEDILVIRNMNGKIKDELFNIAKNNGQTLAGFIKPHLRKIVESYPEKDRQNYDDEE